MKESILIFMPDIFWGGAETQFRRIVKYERKYNIIVCSSRQCKADNWNAIVEFIKSNPQATFLVAEKGLSKIHSLWFYMKKVNEIKKSGYNIKAAIVYDGVSVGLIPYLKTRGIPVIYSERNSGEVIVNETSVKRYILNRCIRQADVLMANSMLAKRLLSNHFGRDVILIKNALEIDELFFRKNTEIKKIIVPARIDPVKNQKLIIDWLIEHPMYDIEIHFAGKINDHLYYGMLCDLISKYKLSNKIKFLGFITDTSALYKEYDMCILPSFTEGMSNVILESFAFGIPILVSNIEMNAINKNTRKYAFSPNSTSELDAVFNSFCNLSDMAKNDIKKANYEYVKKEHSVQKMIQNYHIVLDSL